MLASKVGLSVLSLLFLTNVTIVESLISCGTASSFQHWRSNLYSDSERTLPPLLITSAGISQSLPGYFPCGSILMAFTSSSLVGESSSSCMRGISSTASSTNWDTVFFLSVQNICNGPPIFLSACLIADHLSCCRFRCFGMHQTNGFLNALVHHPDVPSILKSLTIRAKCGSVIVDAHFDFILHCMVSSRLEGYLGLDCSCIPEE